MAHLAALLTLVHLVGPYPVQTAKPDKVVPASPFVGSWTADVAASRFDPKLPLKGATMRIEVTGNDVTINSTVILPSGETQQGGETLRADGTETPGTLTPGVVHIANWVGPHVLAFIARRGSQNIALITYEVSPDGQTLTARTSGILDKTVVFKRPVIFKRQ